MKKTDREEFDLDLDSINEIPVLGGNPNYSKDEDNPFLSTYKLTSLIENTVNELNVSYIDAITHLCELHSIDIEDVPPYISPVIKNKIEAEAMDMNLIPRQARLPI